MKHYVLASSYKLDKLPHTVFISHFLEFKLVLSTSQIALYQAKSTLGRGTYNCYPPVNGYLIPHQF